MYCVNHSYRTIVSTVYSTGTGLYHTVYTTGTVSTDRQGATRR